MINLLNETIKVLKKNEKSENDVLWIGCKEFKTDWKHFSEIANTEYDNGYGGTKIDMELLIVGEDFWLERHEYDGSEWWEFKQMPKKPNKTYNFKSISYLKL